MELFNDYSYVINTPYSNNSGNRYNNNLLTDNLDSYFKQLVKANETMNNKNFSRTSINISTFPSCDNLQFGSLKWAKCNTDKYNEYLQNNLTIKPFADWIKSEQVYIYSSLYF